MPPRSSVRVAKRGESVLFLGESHTLSFSEGIVLRGDDVPLTCLPLFVGDAVSLANVADAQGRLCYPVRRALAAARLLVDDGGAADRADDGVYTTQDRQWRRIAQRRFSVRPLIVLCLGSYDIFRAVVDFPGEDFELPGGLPHRIAGPFARPLAGAIDSVTARAWFAERVEPLRRALASLRDLGLERLAFLSIPPPTLDDRAARQTIEGLGGSGAGGTFRPAFRYKAALLFNALAAEACKAEGAAFLDAWPLLTLDGLVRPGVLADTAHLSEDAVARVLLELIAPAAARPASRIAASA